MWKKSMVLGMLAMIERDTAHLPTKKKLHPIRRMSSWNRRLIIKNLPVPQ